MLVEKAYSDVYKIRIPAFDRKKIEEFKSNVIIRTYSQTDKSWYVFPYLKWEFDYLNIPRNLRYELRFNGKFYDLLFRDISPQNFYKILDWLKARAIEKLEKMKKQDKIPTVEKIFEKMKSEVIINFQKNEIEIPLSLGREKILVLIGEYLFDQPLIQELKEHIEKFTTEIKKSKDYKTDKIVKLPGGQLFEFQARAFEVANERIENFGSVLIADEMGIGKTIQSLAIVFHKKLFPTLVVCPASLKYNWKHEISKFLRISPNQVIVIEGTNPKKLLNQPETFFKGIKFVIVNYDIIHHHLNTLQKLFDFKSMILDEAHYIKNRRAKRTQAIKTLSKKIPVKVFLTGTPIMNNPIEIASILEMTDTLKYFANGITDFERKYTIQEIVRTRKKFFKKTVGYRNLSVLNQRLRATIMIRREKKDIIKELPEKIVSPFWIQLTKEQMKQYLEVKELYEENFVELIEQLVKEGKISKYALPNEIIKERNNDFAETWLMENYPNIYLAKFSKLYETLGILKVPYVVKFVEEYFEENPNSKVVVFAYHKKVQEELFKQFKNKGYNPLKIFSDDTALERQTAARKFQEDESHKVIVLSLMAAKEGLTLTRANLALFSELYFNPQILAQAEDRIHRVGQTDIARIYYFVAEETIDEKIWNEILEPKRQMFKASVSL